MFKLLNLDRVNYLGRRLDKKMFYDNGDFNKEDRKIFADYIDRIEMSYLINSTNLNIQPFINDEYYYKAIAYLKITLKQDGKLDKISKIINNTIPNNYMVNNMNTNNVVNSPNNIPNIYTNAVEVTPSVPNNINVTSINNNQNITDNVKKYIKHFIKNAQKSNIDLTIFKRNS